MANNRMYLRCRTCGHSIFLGAHLATPWMIDVSVDRINMFMHDHFITCCKDRGSHSDDFELAYEDCEHNPELEVDGIDKISYGDEVKWKHIEPPTEDEIREAEQRRMNFEKSKGEFVRKYMEEHKDDFEDAFNKTYIVRWK